jgi:hypothetical protein
MTADPQWAEMADAIIKLTQEVGWWVMSGVGLFILGWKWLDSWGKRKP